MTPNASGNRVEPGPQGEDAQRPLRVRVTASPEKGRANGAAVKLIAKSLGLPKSDIQIIAGATARNKTLMVEGELNTLRARIADLTAGASED